MEPILTRELSGPDGQTYKLTISLNDAEIDLAAGLVPFAVEAECFDPKRDLSYKVDAEVKAEFKGDWIVFTVGIAGTDYVFEVGYSPDALAPDSPDAGSDLLSEITQEDSWIPGEMAASMEAGIEEAIQALPIPFDPLIGCVLKSGVSSTVGQVVRCNNNVLSAAGPSYDRKPLRPSQQVRDVLACLRQNVGHTAKKAFWRTLRCWVMLGFG